MCSDGSNAALPALGFPIREPADQRLFSASPRLIAAVHALHRLRMPRHPPCALTILTVIIAISHVETDLHRFRVSLEYVVRLSIDDVLRSLCSFQRSLRRLSRVFRTTVSQNSTTCEPALLELESPTSSFDVAGQVRSTFQANRAYPYRSSMSDEGS
jgi:hypothetical protein